VHKRTFVVPEHYLNRVDANDRGRERRRVATALSQTRRSHHHPETPLECLQ
jgi:hypothetical protein